LIFAVLICFDVGVENFEIVHPRFWKFIEG
jgi:hypothetical protein